MPLKGEYLKMYNTKNDDIEEDEWDEHLEAVNFFRQHKLNAGSHYRLVSAMMQLYYISKH